MRVGAVVLSPQDTVQARREKLARIVLDEMYQFVGLLDADGNTLEINRAALDGAGVRLDDIEGKPFWHARWFQVSRESAEAQRDYVRRARAGEFVRCDMEVYGEAAGDRTIVVDFSLLPVRDRSGEIVFLLAEGRNITAKKQAEAEVARKNAELQTLLDRVRELDQLKSDMFANVSHELRTPLTLILGPVEELLAAGDTLDERQHQRLEVIRRNAYALLKHVDDLLDLARLDSAKMTLNYARVDLAAQVRRCAEQFHALAPRQRITYRVDTPDSLLAEVDPDKFDRVLLNLLSNAFKFTPRGGHIRCVLETDSQARVLLTVEDSGPGVPAELGQVIFERFRQAQQGTTREHGGTGLGLAIAKEIVELHHGTIGVGPAPGGGAVFRVAIPRDAPFGEATTAAAIVGGPQRAAAAEGVLAELVHAEAPPPRPAADGTRPTVMVVEDNGDLRAFVCDALSAEYQVVAMPDGRAALERLLDAPVDLVLTDLMMPGLGGDQLVEAMRRHAALADVPVLVLSARGDDALRSRLLAESVQDYLTKPFSVQELRARVHNLVGVKLARDALQRELASQSKDLGQLARSLIANQRALQESEHRWFAIYEHSPVGIALFDAAGIIRIANPAFRTMLGFSGEEIRGCPIERLTLVEERAAMRERMTALMAGETLEDRMQRRFHRRNGEIAWANTSVSRIPATRKTEALLMMVTEDITEQKRAERALARTRGELARVTRASTLGELAASIAHEVNQPLAAVVTNGQACLRWLDASPPDEGEVRSAVYRIVRDANRAGEVITRIRNFLRRGEPVHEAVDIGLAIQDVLDMVRGEAQAHQVGLLHRSDDDLPPVIADRIQVQQVMLNLLMNAIEAISRGGAGRAMVTIGARVVDADSVRVDVRDSGAGIDPAAIDRIFDAFYTSKPEGMGMGLAISQSIVEAHGGRLWVTPNEDAGVTFHFTLPADRAGPRA